MDNEKKTLFQQNVERWALFSPQEAEKVKSVVPSSVAIVPSLNPNEINLKKHLNETDEFLIYHNDGFNTEIRNWLLSLNLDDVSFLYVYGIGLGYHYEAIKKWLEGNPERKVVFIEDDEEVIYRFFETELAQDFLNNPQARLFLIDPKKDNLHLYNHLSVLSLRQKRETAAITSYFFYKKNMLKQIAAQLDFICTTLSSIMGEYVQHSLGFLRNYFLNLVQLPNSAVATLTENQFKGVPAIICGAGPSLNKNIHLLKNLADKALIIAGGTAINALNAGGLNPHIGAGIDPNTYQYARYIANQAFEVPFYYRARLNNKALSTVHGEKVYITGTGGHHVSDWIEDQLNIPRMPLDEGSNVVNMSVSLAHALGCDPIVVVGVDLAYSQEQSYAQGVNAHAIHDQKTQFFTKNPNEEPIHKKDIYGNPVVTLWKWVAESLWFGRYAKKNQQKLINATEGGIGFPDVPNLTLEEVAAAHMTKSYDLSGRLHQAIQNAAMPAEVTQERILKLMNTLVASLDRCADIYDQMISAWKEYSVHLLMEDEPLPEGVPPKITTLIGKLENEEAYKAILQTFNFTYIPVLYEKGTEYDFHPAFYSPREIVAAKVDFNTKTQKFLKTAAIMTKALIEDTLNIIKEQKKRPISEITKRSGKPPEEKYSYDEGVLIMQDPEMGLNYKETIRLDKLEGHYELKGKFHGPSSTYHKDGALLSQIWFLNGQRQGKAFFYYKDGTPYSVQRFKNDLWNGVQKFYYADGRTKSVLNYKEGLLDGTQKLYHRNGQLYRELSFKEGKREGKEIVCDENGIQLIEVFYQDDKPVKTAREWYPNGNIAKEIIYDPSGTKTTRLWNENGHPFNEEQVKFDYFNSLTKQTNLLTDTLDQVFKGVESVQPNHFHIEDDLANLKKEMKHLHQLNEQMNAEAVDIDKEALWKTPRNEKGMDRYIKEMTNKMAKDIASMQDALTITLNMLAKDKKDKKDGG